MVINFTSCFRNFLQLKQSGKKMLCFLKAGFELDVTDCGWNLSYHGAIGMLPQVKAEDCPKAEEALEHVFKNTLLQSSAWVCNTYSFFVQHLCPWLLSKTLFTTLFLSVGKLSVNSTFVLSWTKGSCLKFWLSEICFSWLICVVQVVWFPKEPV